DNMERDLIEQGILLKKKKKTREEYVAWEQRCDEFIESLEEQSRIKRPRLSTGNRQSVIACIARLESLKDSVCGRFVHVSTGYGLRWREIETAFESRILTGAIISSNYIEPRRFLEDASEIVLERVQCILRSITTQNYELYQCTDLRECKHVNLVYVEDDSAGHFALIKDLSRLVSSQINRYGHKKYFCDRCLHYFNSSAKLETHSEDCGKLNDCAIRLPSGDDKWLSFCNHCRKECIPFVAYADLECTLEKMASDSQSATHMYQHHNIFSIGHCSYDSSLSGYQFRRDKDCTAWFAEELKNLAQCTVDNYS
ncbi:hypothetical protein ALC60_02572, partial [Trachymyrmex zeteki]